MVDLSLINQKVIDILKEEANEVVYRVWLSFTEKAKFEEGNIVVVVPNQYIKQTFEERYSSDIEELYKNNIDFSKLIVRTEEENEQIMKTVYVEKYFEKIMLSSTQFSVAM
jgi:chromosomal replication initiation ATPase DnaA